MEESRNSVAGCVSTHMEDSSNSDDFIEAPETSSYTCSKCTFSTFSFKKTLYDLEAELEEVQEKNRRYKESSEKVINQLIETEKNLDQFDKMFEESPKTSQQQEDESKDCTGGVYKLAETDIQSSPVLDKDEEQKCQDLVGTSSAETKMNELLETEKLKIQLKSVMEQNRQLTDELKEIEKTKRQNFDLIYDLSQEVDRLDFIKDNQKYRLRTMMYVIPEFELNKNEELRENINNLKKTQECFLSDIKELKQEIDLLSKDNADLQKNIERLKEINQMYSPEMGELESENLRYLDYNKDLFANIQCLQTTVDSVEEIMEENAKLKTALKECEQKCFTKSADIDHLQQTIKNQSAVMNELEESLRQLDKEKEETGTSTDVENTDKSVQVSEESWGWFPKRVIKAGLFIGVAVVGAVAIAKGFSR